MIKSKNIILIGMSTSGKTTVGKIIAKMLNKKMIDEDVSFEKEYGLIGKMKAEKGVDYFHKKRTEHIKKISVLKNTVFSTGGGTGISADIKYYDGIIIYLNINSNRLNNNFKSIKNKHLPQNSRRLLLNSTDLERSLMLKKRHPIYTKNANIIINANTTIQKIVALILKKLRQKYNSKN